MAANLMDKVQARYARDNYVNGMAVQQLMTDAAVIALNRTFGFGAKRCAVFVDALHEAASDMAALINDDTPDAQYAKDKIDAVLLQIVGEDRFAPWDDRYLAAINPNRGNREQRRARKKKGGCR